MTVILTVMTSWMVLSVLLGVLLAGMIRTEEAWSEGCCEMGARPEPARAGTARTADGVRTPVH